MCLLRFGPLPPLLPPLLIALPSVVAAQTAAPAEPVEDEIVVTAERLAGTAIGDVPPVVELGPEAIASYGANSLTEILTAIAPQTGPGRGRGGGGPVILLDGQRISGFAEIRDLPPEAIQRVQILPEEVALKYGFSADQRVVNFILKPQFAAFTADIEQGHATRGARRERELQGTLVRLDNGARLTLTGEYTDATRILESDRGIIPQATVFPFAQPGDFRTLLPATQTLRLNGVLARKLIDGVSASINASWQRDTSDALLGLPVATVSAANGGPITRGFLPTLARGVTTDALRGGLTVNGTLDRFTWTLTGALDRTTTRTTTDRGIDVAALQAAILAPGSAIDPRAASFLGPVALLARDSARAQSDTSSGIYTLSGPLFELPAGAVRMTARGGFATTRLNAVSTRGGATLASRLARDEANGRLNLDVPLANADRGVAAPIGKLTINANVAYRRLSDFGGLLSFGYGLNWQPVDGLTILASALGSENEPGLSDLGGPVIVTPGIPTFDFGRGETVLVTRTTGGNGGLLAEVQRDTKLSVNWQPTRLKGLTLSADYFRNRSRNPVAAFPLLTPDLEAAFPGRATRDGVGRLLAIDARPVNFAATASDVVRIGFTFQREWGQAQRGPLGGLGRGGGGGRPGGGGPGGAGSGGGGAGGFRQMGLDGGRWTLALYDSIRFRDTITIRQGLPPLDLLGGDATGNTGGAPRHNIDLDAGYFNKGFGVRLTGSYQAATTVVGTTAASTLRFGPLTTFNTNIFYNFDAAKSFVARAPFFKGSRLRLGITNIFDSIRDIRDGSGLVPLGYQPGFVDPRGRYIELDFRKTF